MLNGCFETGDGISATKIELGISITRNLQFWESIKHETRTEIQLFRNEYNRYPSEPFELYTCIKTILDFDKLSGEEGGEMQRSNIRRTIYLDPSMCFASNKHRPRALRPKILRIYALSDMKSFRSQAVRRKIG